MYASRDHQTTPFRGFVLRGIGIVCMFVLERARKYLYSKVATSIVIIAVVGTLNLFKLYPRSLSATETPRPVVGERTGW